MIKLIMNFTLIRIMMGEMKMIQKLVAMKLYQNIAFPIKKK